MSSQPWSNIQDFGNGIVVYKNAISPELNLINRLENCLDGKRYPYYAWQPARVGYHEKRPDVRDCVDFKFKKTDIAHDTSEVADELRQIWQDVYDVKSIAVKEYRKRFNISELRYWESFNFIKYEPGNHFVEHHDHGSSYNCTVSVVGYINDDYEGGEIYFRLQDLNYKADKGDIVIFPSNYMYPHTAKVVHSGTKYAIVTMLDYSDKYHNPKFFRETGT